MSSLPVCLQLLLSGMFPSDPPTPQKSPSMKALVTFKPAHKRPFSRVPSVWLLAAMFPITLLSTVKACALRPHRGSPNRALASWDSQSFCPPDPGTLATENGEGFVFWLSPPLFFAAPLRPIGSFCFVYRKWSKYKKGSNTVTVWSFALESARWQSGEHGGHV